MSLTKKPYIFCLQCQKNSFDQILKSSLLFRSFGDELKIRSCITLSHRKKKGKELDTN